MLQRTPEWFAARAGMVTASRIKDVIAENKDKAEPAARRNYRRELVLEIYSGIPQESGFASFAMQQGLAKEAAARETYAFVKNAAVEEAGFVRHPTIARAGASPDGFIGADGILEIKCPEANAMWEMLVGMTLDKAYRNQVMWQMACCPERKWADVVFYREGLPLKIINVRRDGELVGALENQVREFLAEVEAEYAMLCKARPR